MGMDDRQILFNTEDNWYPTANGKKVYVKISKKRALKLMKIQICKLKEYPMF